ncbi:MAG: hypothetical protein AMJ95_04215 [Omnitrophica WOR_2 bacterium SM23_72]|nr:MAG: hypothetical protein AMJ95_04215 [Omnitrophica WOR_2 bacterium SM23_72]
MRFLGIIFYTGVLTLIGVALMVFSLNKLEPQILSDVLVSLQSNTSTRLVIGLSGALLILISYSFAQLILGRFQQEKTIAFPTSVGQVTIALSAVEDLVRRLTGILPEIKELRPNVRATKKGSIVVDLRVVLKSEANIPELTSRLQELARSRIQEVLGIEEQIIIRIHVAKIIGFEERERKRRETEKEEPRVPFSGYGRV